jgi:hypothetical protein
VRDRPRVYRKLSQDKAAGNIAGNAGILVEEQAKMIMMKMNSSSTLCVRLR